MKPVLFLLNDRWSVARKGTTSRLMLASHQRGHSVFVTDVVHLQAVSATELFAEALEVPASAKVENVRQLGSRIGKAKPIRISLSEMQAIFVRTTPGKDIARAWAHRLALEVLRLADETGVQIVNRPVGLQRASSKLYTVCLPPEFVPRTMVCHSLNSVRAFVEELDGPFVMKPLLGSQGRDVFFLTGPDALNTRQVVDILGRTGYLVVQEYIPEAEDGDIRVRTLDKTIVSPPDRAIGIRRIPAAGERRSNVSLGGKAEVTELTKRQATICRKVAKVLHKDGIRFAGLDLIGEKIVEVNVFSPSGLQEIAKYVDEDISRRVVETLIGA